VSNRNGFLAHPLAADNGRRRVELALLAALAFAIGAFSRDFTWLHVRLDAAWPYVHGVASPFDSFAQAVPSGLPIFVTEAFLALLTLSVAVRRLRDGRSAGPGDWILWSLLPWLLVGLYELVRGLAVGPTLALRDFAIIYYAAFFYVAAAVCDRWPRVAAVCLAFWVGTVVSLMAAVVQYADVGLWPHGRWPERGDTLPGYYGIYFLVAVLAGTAIWPRLERRGRWIFSVYASLATFALFFSQQRSLMIAFAIGFFTLLMGRAVAGVSLRPVWRLAAGIAAAALVLEVARRAGGAGGAPPFAPVQLLMQKTGETAVANPAGGELELTGTARFRQDAWAEAWRRFRAQPLRGEGFGTPFVFYDTGLQRWWTQDVRPHNAYLTVLYKMGVAGFAAFALVHVTFYRRVWGALRAARASVGHAAMWGLMSALVGMQVYACANLFFESPFLAVVYWSVMGLIASLAQLDA
jgi:O-antigen ligase